MGWRIYNNGPQGEIKSENNCLDVKASKKFSNCGSASKYYWFADGDWYNSKDFRLKNYGTGNCLASSLTETSCSSSSTQKWRYDVLGGWYGERYRFRNVGSNKCISQKYEFAGRGNFITGALFMATCKNDDDQKWILSQHSSYRAYVAAPCDGCDEDECGQNDESEEVNSNVIGVAISVKLVTNGQCLQLNGNNVVGLALCDGEDQQQWIYYPETKELTSKHNGMCLDYAVTMNQINSAYCGGGLYQKWEYVPTTLQIKSLQDGRCVGINNSKLVILSVCDIASDQTWEITASSGAVLVTKSNVDRFPKTEYSPKETYDYDVYDDYADVDVESDIAAMKKKGRFVENKRFRGKL